MASVLSLLDAAHAQITAVILMVIVVAMVILADATLTALAVVPSIVGVLAAAVLSPASDHPRIVVALGVLATSIWLVRRYPRANPKPWVPVAATAAAACASVVAAVAGVPCSAITPIVVGGLAAALAQSLIATIVRRLFHQPWIDSDAAAPGSDAHQRAVLKRYAHLPPTIRYWAYGKLRLDPLFAHLDRHAPTRGRLLDIGCGYALPAVWLAVLRPELHIDAFDALPRRVRIARHVLDRRGRAACGDVNDWTEVDSADDPYDGALCIDVLHHLPRPSACLRAIASRLRKDGVLLLRTTIRTQESENETRSHIVERWMVRLRGQRTVRFYDEEEVRRLLTEAGFDTVEMERPQDGRVETLFVASRQR